MTPTIVRFDAQPQQNLAIMLVGPRPLTRPESLQPGTVEGPEMPEDYTTERWLPVVGWEGLYEVSNAGRVRCLPRHRVRGGLLSLVPNSNGYVEVTLSGRGVRLKRKAHHLVLEAFVGPRPAGMECLHINDVKTDNHLGNLRWGTHRENLEDIETNGRRLRGKNCTQAVLTEEMVLDGRRRYAGGESFTVIANALGCKRDTLTAAVTGRSWLHLPEAVASRGSTDNRGAPSLLNEASVREIRAMRAAGTSYRDIAEKFGIRVHYAKRVARGEMWSWVT